MQNHAKRARAGLNSRWGGGIGPDRNQATDDPERTANRLYQVLDAAPTTAQWNASDQPVTHLVMTDAERLMLADIGDGPLIQAESNAQMNATFITTVGDDSETRYQTGVRVRGAGSRRRNPR